MPRDPKSEIDTPEPYRRYRVPDPTVPEATVENATDDDDVSNTCGLLFTIVLSLFSVAFYLGIFGLIAWVIASMLGLID